MMTKSILKSNGLVRIRELLERYEFDVRGYVDKHLWELYKIPEDKYHRSRVAVSV